MVLREKFEFSRFCFFGKWLDLSIEIKVNRFDFEWQAVAFWRGKRVKILLLLILTIFLNENPILITISKNHFCDSDSYSDDANVIFDTIPIPVSKRIFCESGSDSYCECAEYIFKCDSDFDLDFDSNSDG